MRAYRHDVRDLSQALLLGFDIRRLMLGILGVVWTAVVILGFHAIFTWRALNDHLTTENAVAADIAWRALRDTRLSPERVMLWLSMAGIWWLGFSRLAGPIQRSQALEVSRDRRPSFKELTASARRLGGLVTFGPMIAAAVPAGFFGLVALWALLAKIPGAAGEILSLIFLPVALVLGLLGGFALITVLFAAPFMPPAAVVEGHDILEAVSRAISYMYQRPFRFVAYFAVKLGVKAAALLLAALLLAGTWAFLLGGLYVVGEGVIASDVLTIIFNPSNIGEDTSMIAHSLGGIFWSTAAVALGWWVVLALGSDLMMYLLLRFDVDGITYDEVMDPQEYMAAHRHLNALETAEQAAKSLEESPPATPAPATPAPAAAAEAKS